MMPPAQGQGRLGLTAVDEAAAVPFSALFDHSFDLATVEATAQLADKSIFVTSTGRRFRFESIPGDNADENANTSSNTPAHAQHVSAYPPMANTQYPIAPRSFPPSDGGSPIKRRPASHASSHTHYSPSDQQSVRGSGQKRSSVEPKIPTHHVTTMMSHLNINRFSASPMYGESDGGVQAAETLMDLHYTRPSYEHDQQTRSPTINTNIPPTLASPGANGPLDQTQQRPTHSSSSNRIAQFDYPNYMAQAQIQTPPRQSAGYPSLLEFASPLTPSPLTPTPASPPVTHGFATTQGYYTTAQGRIAQGRSAQGYYSTAEAYTAQGYYSPQDYEGSRGYESASGYGTSPPAGTGNYQQPYYDVNRVHTTRSHFDTETPVIVAPEPRGHLASISNQSDSSSSGRDNVLPGEDMLFDGPVKSSQSLASPDFQDGQIKVFRNTISNDLRFYCKVGYNTETYRVKANNAELVPVYAYDPRFPNVVHIRDKDDCKNGGNSYNQAAPGNGQPSGAYQFYSLKEMCDFQARLTGEKVVLDIASVKLVRLGRASSSKGSDTYSSVRLQIWHEAEAGEGVPRRGPQSDVASFVTAGTALSGPLRDRLVASSSRLIIYLGRLGEYITVFITDDIEVKAEGQTMVKLKPRKAGSFSKKGSGSRWPGVKAHIEPRRGSEMAGLDISGQALNIDIESTFDLYKTFEIDFENSPSQDNFIRKWDEVINERRAQRKKLDRIQEEMEHATFSGRKAREIW
ncbi:hypothetical protein QBC46DRAFT_380088 [Diplogelasinospora grovesii]|uniref:Uncharacterized protein n=1 Tax=Diplogelasinospora grovesii TaxID=303347 RepID=A0AAN6NCA1_9PEZI|nr:hypothetical protein QBC46DRAFT_380088 [Diplogelasinospora grovesii]